jgi:hypothetical protein
MMKRAKTPAKPARMRLSLDLPPHEGEVLERLAATTGGSKTEVIKRAISLMEAAVAARAKGRTLAVASGDKLLSTIIV